MIDTKRVIAESPDNFVIQNALVRCAEIIDRHNKIMCSVSGGADSDVMMDMIIRCGGKEKTTFVFFDTGLEYTATKEHLKYLEEKYGIDIVICKACKSIPASCRDYGVPFWGKFASNMIYRLQSHGFKWEDEQFETLMQKYPNCKTALSWWCGITKGNTTQYSITRAPFLKEYIIQNPPTFLISDKCCQYAKKQPAHHFAKEGEFDLVCIGVRQSEGGVRAGVFKNCFSETTNGDADQFRPIFWLRDSDKEAYCSHYGIKHSRCYSEYGLKRTGCFGCPFGKSFEHELDAIYKYEPRLYKAAETIFGESYDYTRGYLEFRSKMKKDQLCMEEKV